LGYWHAQSKVFFRPRVHEKLTLRLRHALGGAALVVQACSRARSARKTFLLTKKGAQVAQRLVRGFLARREFHRRQAARVLQAAVRRRQARTRFVAGRVAAVCAQRVARGWLARKLCKTLVETRAQAMIGAHWRRYTQQRYFHELRFAVVKAQGLLRTKRAVAKYLRRLKDAKARGLFEFQLSKLREKLVAEGDSRSDLENKNRELQEEIERASAVREALDAQKAQVDELAEQLRASNEAAAKESAVRARQEREHEQVIVKLRMERDAAKKAAVGHLREERLDKMKEEQKRMYLTHEGELKELRAMLAQARRELRAVQKERDELFTQDRVKTCQLEDIKAEMRELGQYAGAGAAARTKARPPKVAPPLGSPEYLMATEASRRATRGVGTYVPKPRAPGGPRHFRHLTEMRISEDCVHAVSITPDKSRIVTASDDKRVRVWDITTGLCEHSWEYESTPRALATDSLHVYAGFGDASIVKYDVGSWEATSFASGHAFTVYVLLFAKGAPLVGERHATPMVSGAGDGELRVFDAAACTLVHALRGHNAAVKALAAVHGAPLGASVMLSGGDDGEVRVWEMATWTCLHALTGRGSGINSIVSLGASAPTADKPACVRVACASDDGYIYSYEYQKEAGWGECAAVSAHKDVVWALGSISGLIVSASEDKLIRVWPASTPPPWECMETLTGHGDAVCCLAVTQNHVFSASSDGMLHMWKLV